MTDIEKIRERMKINFYKKIISINSTNNAALKFISTKIGNKSELTEIIETNINSNIEKLMEETAIQLEREKKVIELFILSLNIEDENVSRVNVLLKKDDKEDILDLTLNQFMPSERGNMILKKLDIVLTEKDYEKTMLRDFISKISADKWVVIVEDINRIITEAIQLEREKKVIELFILSLKTKDPNVSRVNVLLKKDDKEDILDLTLNQFLPLERGNIILKFILDTVLTEEDYEKTILRDFISKISAKKWGVIVKDIEDLINRIIKRENPPPVSGVFIKEDIPVISDRPGSRSGGRSGGRFISIDSMSSSNVLNAGGRGNAGGKGGRGNAGGKGVRG